MRSLWNYLFGGSQAATPNAAEYNSLSSDVPVTTIDDKPKNGLSDINVMPDIIIDGIGEPLETIHLTETDFMKIKKLEYNRGLKTGVLSAGIVFGIIVIIIVSVVVFACK